MYKYKKALKTYTKAPKIVILLVLLSYVFFTVFYMGPSTWNCKDTLYGFGDNTAGPVWRFGLEPKQAPLGSYEKMTNYPIGENLYSPTNYSLSGQSYMIWAASRTLGPVCGYNVINMVGFIATAMVMFGFIYTLTRRKWIAWLAGFAVSFSPYYQMKVGGHPGYGYGVLLIAATWAFFNLIKKKRKRDAAYFAALSASCFYFDPYFSLLVVSIIAPLVVSWLGLSFIGRSKSKKNKDTIGVRFKLLIRAGIIFLALLLPLIFIAFNNIQQISTSVAASRGNVLLEAQACSNLPHEYVTPFVLHPVFERAFGQDSYNITVTNLANDFTCGIGEDSVGISIAIAIVTTIGLIVIFWELLNKRKIILKLEYDKKTVIVGMVLVLITGVVLALPPIKLFGVIPTPSYALLEITTTWRTLTRFYVVVNFATITLFTIVLVYFSSYFRQFRRFFPIVFILLFGLILLEYQAFKPFTGNKLSTFSYKTDIPEPYRWLKKQKDINVIAEYPLERSGGESNAMAYYLSMQIAHEKKLFNGNIPTTKDEEVKASLKDISDPQTRQTLASVGVDAVVIHGVPESEVKKIDGLEIIHSSPQDKFNLLAFTPIVKNDNVVIVRINNQTRSVDMLTFFKGFARNTTIIKSAVDWNYEAINGSEMRITPIPGRGKSKNDALNRCFDIKMSGQSDYANLSVIADGKKALESYVGPEFVSIQVNAKNSIILKNDKGYNMQVGNIGCK